MEKPLFNKKYTLEWKDLNPIRGDIEKSLKTKDINKKDTDSIVIIVNELMENICKYSEKKIAHIYLLHENDNQVSIRLEQPITEPDKDNIKILMKEIKRANSYKDTQKLVIDSLKRTFDEGGKSRVGLALIRNTAKGAKIDIRKSRNYDPGIVVIVKYLLT
ncbi:MAG: hypothetical protein JW969_10455 [Spirochaetales bacterium]|nr:hypothetical protein [Spirochaetales bacterium]